MIKRPGASHYEPIEWDDAYDVIAAELRALDDPDQALFYTSGRTSNEAAFAYQLFVRAFGTNNLPDCSNMCHESTSVALAESIGIGKASVTLSDVYNAELIILAGQNPGTNHPRMLSALEIAKRKGARILTINPLREAGLLNFRNPQIPRGVVGHGTDLSDLHLPVKINGDLALFQAFGHLLVQWGALDEEFIAAHTTGFEAWRAHVADLDWDFVTETTGLSREQITEAAQMLRESKATVFCWAMGLTQHHNSVAVIKEVCNVAFAQGNIGRRGAGLLPVRGHSNVQGDRTMGIWERPAGPVPGRAAGRVRIRPAPRTRLRHGRRHPCAAGRQGQRLHRTRRQLRPGRPGHRCDVGGPAEGVADRARVDEAEPVAPGVRPDGPDPADAGSHRDRRAGQRAAVRHRRGLDVQRARLPRAAGAGQSAAALGGVDRDQHRRSDTGGPIRPRLGGHAA